MYSSQKTNNQTTTKFSIHRKGKGVNAKTPVTLSIAFMIELNTLYKTHLNTWKRKKEKKGKKRKKRKKRKKNKKKEKKKESMPHLLTHFPTWLFQPMMEELTQACDLTTESASKVHLLRRTPSSITTRGPTTTLGPMRQSLPIFAVGSFGGGGSGVCV